MKFRHNAILKDDPLAGVADPEKKVDSDGKVMESEEMTIVQHMHNHRRLNPRQIQLLAIAGTIGESSKAFFFTRLLSNLLLRDLSAGRGKK